MVPLTIPQKRALQASLLLFEESLRTTDRLLNSRDEIGILYYRKSRLSSQRRQLIQKKVSSALIDLAIFVKKLELEPIRDNLEGMIMGEMSISWENLEECRSKRLRGYGKLDPIAVEVIDPAIDQLARTALEINRLIAFNPASNSPENNHDLTEMNQS
jgi:hypothetical protein